MGATEIARFDYASWKGDKSALHVEMTDRQGKLEKEEDESDDN